MSLMRGWLLITPTVPIVKRIKPLERFWDNMRVFVLVGYYLARKAIKAMMVQREAMENRENMADRMW